MSDQGAGTNAAAIAATNTCELCGAHCGAETAIQSRAARHCRGFVRELWDELGVTNHSDAMARIAELEAEAENLRSELVQGAADFRATIAKVEQLREALRALVEALEATTPTGRYDDVAALRRAWARAREALP